MKLGVKYAWVYFTSASALFLERFWHAFWPALSVLALFLACACLNLLTAFGPQAHLALLVVFVAAFSLASTRLGAPFRLPRGRDVRRTIEIASALRHRPLEAMLDKPVEGTHESGHKLWASYQDRLTRLRDRLKTHRPRPIAAGRDPYAVRFAAITLLALSLITAQGEAGYRIRQAFFVDVTQLYHPAPVALDAWITPPDYTHVNPVFLATTQLGAQAIHGPVTVPENSVLKVRLSGYDDPPHVTYAGAETPPFNAAAARSFTMEMPLTKDGELKIKKGWFRTLGKWQVSVTPDTPPEITLLGTEKGDRASMKIKYKVADDYGVKKIYGLILPTDALRKTLAANNPIEFDIPVPDDLKKDEQVHVADLAAHPWAGSEVMLTLTAVDAAGQETTTKPQKVLLPERTFENPTAQRIIAERKRLIWYENLITDRLVAEALANIANVPANYKYDPLVFLGLDMASKRLVYDGGPESVESDVRLLWDLAVRVEDGGLTLASRELSDALQRLEEGLKDKSLTKDQIQDLMDQVQQKMREYVKTLAQEMQQRMQEGKQTPQLSQELADKLMKRVDMGKLMEQMKELTQGSERERMEKMAQFLRHSVENFDPKKLDQMREAQRKALEALNNLEKLIQRQQSLLDHTNKMPPKPGQKNQQQQQDQQQQSGDQQSQQDQTPGGSQGQEDNQQSGSNGQQDDQQQTNGQQGDEDEQPQDQQGQQQQQPGGQQGQQQQQAGGQQGQQQQQTGGQQGQQQQQPGGQQGQQQQQAGGQQNQQQQQAGGQQGQQQQQADGQQGQQQQQAGGQQSQQGQQGQQGSAGMSSPMPGLPSPLGLPGQQQMGQGQGQQPGQQGHQGQQMQQAGGGDTGRKQQAGGSGGEKIPQGGAGGDQQQAAAGGGGKEKFPDVKTPKEGAAEQGAIRNNLGDLMRSLGGGMSQIPDQFAKADQQMKAAQEALKGGDTQGSAAQQREALQNLQKAEDQALQQMAQSMQMMLSMGFNPGDGSGDGGYGDGFDPLGREGDNGKEGGVIKLPDEKERRRVQQIIEELRSRSNEYQRPKVERDYIDRLLQTFD